MSSAGEERLCFSREDDGWQSEHGSSPLHEARVENLRVVVWRRHELWSQEVADIADNVDDSEPHLMARRCQAALGLLSERSPRYFAWVARVVRFAAPWVVRSSERPSGSGSTNFAPGLIGIGNHEGEFPLADTLVHEASHHYFFIALRLGAVHDGRDTRLYFNPFLQMNRPLDRILFSYHAFANVLLFCRELEVSGSTGRDYLEGRVAHLEKCLGVLDQELASTTSLTTAGHTLWEHLRGKIHLAEVNTRHAEASR
jgi:HEXXH motif-containing protein